MLIDDNGDYLGILWARLLWFMGKFPAFSKFVFETPPHLGDYLCSSLLIRRYTPMTKPQRIHCESAGHRSLAYRQEVLLPPRGAMLSRGPANASSDRQACSDRQRSVWLRAHHGGTHVKKPGMDGSITNVFWVSMYTRPLPISAGDSRCGQGINSGATLDGRR